MKSKMIYVTSVLVLCLFNASIGNSKDSVKNSIIIKGIITNIEEIKTNLNSDTCLQL